MKFSVKSTVAKTRRALTRYERRALPKAEQQALNRTTKSARSVAVKIMGKELGLKQKNARAGTKIISAKPGRLVAGIEGRGRPINVIRTMTPAQISSWRNSPKRPRPPLRAKPWKVKRVFRERVFIGNMGRTVFIRTGKARGAIRGLYGPSIANELIRKDVVAAVERRVGERFPVELRRALDNQLRKAGFK